MNNNFENIINLPTQIYENLATNGIRTPSKVQERTFEVASIGNDLIVVSPTGTGKTLAYLLPVFSMLKNDVAKPQALILAPTHELAAQIKKETDIYAKNTNIKSALIIGGANIQRQLEALKEKPQIIIGSAGRISELNNMKKLSLHFVKTIVIDEADRMLNEKNITQVKNVISATLKDRRLMFFSASMNEEALKTANELSKNAEVVNISESKTLPDSIEHLYFECEKRDKVEILRKIIHALRIKKAIVFSGKQGEAENIAARLNYHGLKAVSLGGKDFKEERRLAIESFKNGKTTVLSATDLAARGLDIKLSDVFVFCIGCPTDADVYLHRAGRTGRMNKKGTAISIISPDEKYRLKRIEKTLKIKISECKVSDGKIKPI